MSITEDMATQWDYPTALRVVIPKQDRDFSRPKQPFFTSTAPLDDNMADTQDIKIKEVQTFLKSSPLGVSYSGPVNGIMNPSLMSSLSNLEKKVFEKFHQKIPMLFGDKIVLSNFKKAISLIQSAPTKIETTTDDRKKFYQNQLNKPSSDDEEEEDEDLEESEEDSEPESSLTPSTNSSEQIIQLQKMFNLPPTGKLDQKLIQALQMKEKQTAKILGDNSAIGMLFDPASKTIGTTPSEIAKADQLINDYLKSKKNKEI